jgi:hypothetical protein
MATYNFNFSGAGGSAGYTGKLTLTEQTINSTDISNNSSRIKWTLQLTSKSGYSFSDMGTTSKVTLNGTSVLNQTKRLAIGKNSTITIASGTFTCPHNSDGSKTMSFSASISQSSSLSWAIGSGSTSGNLTLSTIPRAASYVSFTGSSVDGTFTFTYNSKATFNYKLIVKTSDGAVIKTIGPESHASGNQSFSWTFTSAERNTIYGKYPTQTTATISAYVETYNSSTLIGSTSTATIKPSIPSSIKPSTPSITPTVVNTGNISDWPVYVQGYSKIKVNVSASPGTGASISSYTITVDGISISNGGQAGPFSNGTKTINVTAYDTRGRSTSNSTTFTVQPYSNPSISITAQRCTSNGVLSSSGTYLLITPQFSYSTVAGYNSITKSISCNGVSNTTFANGDAFVLAANLDVAKVYTVTAKISDTVGNGATIYVDIPTDNRPLNFNHDKTGAAFGGFSTLPNVLDVAWDGRFRQNVEVDGELKIDGSLPLVRRTPPNLPSGVNYYRAFCSETDINTSTDKYWCMIDSTNTWWRGTQTNGAETVAWERIKTYFNFLNFYPNQSEYNKQNGARKGYVGYPSEGNYELYICNEKPKSNIRLKVKGSTNVAGEVALNPSFPAFQATQAFDGQLYLGISSSKWRAVFATNGTIQTSDRRLKHDIKTIGDKYIALFQALKPIQYMMNSGDRIHIGFISQDVEEAMQEVGLSDLEFAGFCKDKKQKEVEIKDTYIDENGEEKEKIDHCYEDVLDEDGNPEYEYSLRYEEFIALNTRMIQDLMAKVEDQQIQINELKQKIEKLKGEKTG